MAAEKLAAVGLSGFERRLPSELSGGQQQRVAVARAIVLEPKVLLFDEPLSNLDAKLRRRVREDIRGLQQSLGLTVVYVTHDQEEALAVSDRIIVMQSARIVQDGTPRDLYERAGQPLHRRLHRQRQPAAGHAAAARRGDWRRSELGGTALSLPHRDLPAGPVEVAVRPQAIRLRPAGSSPASWPASIRKAAYLGSHMEYQVELIGNRGRGLRHRRQCRRAARPRRSGRRRDPGGRRRPGAGRRGDLMHDLDEREAFGLDLALRAGALALGMRRTLAPIEAKSAIDFCTEADRAVEQLVRAEIAQRFGDAVIGEEYGGDAADRVWVVDPIDGTAGYIHGSGRWCVSLAYLQDGEIEIGVLYAPADDRLFVGPARPRRHAQRRGRSGSAAWRMARRRWSRSAGPSVGRWRPIATLLQRLTEAGIEFRRNGSGALGLAEVACGLNDGYAELHINAWDALAGILLVREAGGWTNDFLADDGLARGNLLLAATPSISDRLVAMTQDLHRMAEPPAALAG